MIPEAHHLFSSMTKRQWFYQLLERLGTHRFAEVGVYRGDFFQVLMQAKGIQEALAIDCWELLPDESREMLGAREKRVGWDFKSETMKQLRLSFEKTWAHDPRVHVIHDFSVHAASQIPDGSLDLVYIDGWHDYENVRTDITAWRPKVRSGGVISGHDYNPRQGVYKAVNEFIVAEGLQDRFHFFSANSGNWMALLP